MAKKTDYELIIVGAGPAGMAAGVYAARKQLDTLIISENVGGQTLWSSGIENYLGFVFVSGTDLVQKFEEHLRTFDVELEYARVKRVYQSNDGFGLDTEDGRTLSARAVILASGKSPRLLDVPGEKEFTGRGVTYCSTCDAPMFSGMPVAVAGGGNSGLDAVVQLMKICPKVYLVEIADVLRADEVLQEKARSAPNVEILTHTAVKEIRGDQFVDSAIVEDLHTHETRRLEVKGVFVEIGLVPNTDFVKDLVALNKYGEIPVDCAAWTGIPGLFAAGDVTDVPQKQIICAAGDGAKAALGAYSYLVRLPVLQDWSKQSAMG
jgi:alkyl hydroperoxide reductase subunit F